MLKLNYDKIREKELELTQFEGWLPFRFDSFINLNDRFDYLQAVGLYDKERKHAAHYKYMLMNSDNPEEVMDRLILQFVEKNPQFEDLIK